MAQALFRAGVIEQYGTGIPRIKEACEAAGVSFRYRQSVNSTVLIFDRPGSKMGDSHGTIAGSTPKAIPPRYSKRSTRPR